MLTESYSCTLSCVIVNYRTPQLVTECLATLLPELEGLDARVMVVDNHSGDDSPATIQAWLSSHDVAQRVALVQAQRNAGFSAGNNVGIRSLKAHYYLLLNSDTLIRPGAIRGLLEAAQQYPQAGLFSPRLEWPDGQGQESCFRFPTPLSEFSGATQTGFIERLLGSYVVALPVQDCIMQPQWTSFACVLIKNEVFQQIGLMDEGYFMYFEDVEFCFRAKRAGWEIVHDPRAHVVHLRGGSSPVKERTRQKKRLPRYFYESRTRCFSQMYGRPVLVLANLLWWMGRVVSKIRQVLGRPDKAAIEGQWLDIWTNWLNPLKPWRPLA
jgi:GT2 family glycosyltransferase